MGPIYLRTLDGMDVGFMSTWAAVWLKGLLPGPRYIKEAFIPQGLILLASHGGRLAETGDEWVFQETCLNQGMQVRGVGHGRSAGGDQ